MSLFLAHLRHAGVRWKCPELEKDRKWVADRQTDANDPSRKWGCIAAVETMSIFAGREEQIHAADHANGTCFARLVQRFTALRIVE
jgi:hypothetical protein